jgi:hypothetical protein
MQYTAKGNHNREFELFDTNNNSLGILDYTQWFSIKAKVVMPNGDNYEIAPSNFWQTAIEMYHNDTVIASVKRNWVMNVIVTLGDSSHYYFKSVGLLNRHFALITEQDHEIAVLKPDFQWSKLSFHYEIETDDNYKELSDPVIILFLMYCCNFIHSKGGGAAVAIGA